jgi:hypothetical protein
LSYPADGMQPDRLFMTSPSPVALCRRSRRGHAPSPGDAARSASLDSPLR